MGDGGVLCVMANTPPSPAPLSGAPRSYTNTQFRAEHYRSFHGLLCPRVVSNRLITQGSLKTILLKKRHQETIHPAKDKCRGVAHRAGRSWCRSIKCTICRRGHWRAKCLCSSKGRDWPHSGRPVCRHKSPICSIWRRGYWRHSAVPGQNLPPTIV